MPRQGGKRGEKGDRSVLLKTSPSVQWQAESSEGNGVNPGGFKTVAPANQFAQVARERFSTE